MEILVRERNVSKYMVLMVITMVIKLFSFGHIPLHKTPKSVKVSLGP